MRALGNIIAVGLMIVGVLCLLPLMLLGFGLLSGLAVFVVWLLPFVIIATSDKTTGVEKILWLLAMVTLSWFAWIFYFLLAPIKPRHRYDHYDYRY